MPGLPGVEHRRGLFIVEHRGCVTGTRPMWQAGPRTRETGGGVFSIQSIPLFHSGGRRMERFGREVSLQEIRDGEDEGTSQSSGRR